MAKLLIFNWKMNPATPGEASVLAQASDYENVVVAPPFPFLETVADVLIKAKLGAQDLFWEAAGAFTGEVSAQELKNIGTSHVIVGHSERRHKLGESDEVVAKKMKAAIDAGLIPILCVGETKEQRENGNWQSVIEGQLNSAISQFEIPPLKFNFLIAYEPVWAIGTGDPETPEHAAETIGFIKKILSNWKLEISTKILYGGSVDSRNLKNFLQRKEIDGALVGGASLKIEEVEKMVKML